MKPKRPRMAMTSAPERRRSLGMRRSQLHRNDDGRVWRESQGLQIFVGEMKLDRLSQILGDLVQGVTLSHDGNLEALGRVARLFTGPNHSLDCSLKHWVRLLESRGSTGTLILSGRCFLCGELDARRPQSRHGQGRRLSSGSGKG